MTNSSCPNTRGRERTNDMHGSTTPHDPTTKKKEKKNPSRIRNSIGYIERVWVIGREKTQKSALKHKSPSGLQWQLNLFGVPWPSRHERKIQLQESSYWDKKWRRITRDFLQKRRHLARQSIFIVRVLVRLNSRIAVKPTKPFFFDIMILVYATEIIVIKLSNPTD